jgi:cell division protein YceG involved in septum cleavage
MQFRTLLGSLVVVGGCVNPDAPAPGGDSSEFVFSVPAGSSMNGIGVRLVELGLAPSEFKWKWYLRSADGTCLKAGDFLLRRDMSMAEVRETVCGAPVANDEPFTVVEGWRIRDIDAALVAKGWIEVGDFTRAANRMTAEVPFDVPVQATSYEGYLYPDTYMVSPPPRFTPSRHCGDGVHVGARGAEGLQSGSCCWCSVEAHRQRLAFRCGCNQSV